ncbi:Shedu anti-phage system protein SduA domain-containing protein [Nocardiopsis sp. NPDC006938]|uniref:Shedu anti-phage system protein SduA domain-containing protein n=1 Tax=Nocardiopsis sp. NPDC006938 TaxID=3364337 RepID=UPI0036C42E17
MAAETEERRQSFVSLVRETDLLEVAAAFLLPSPELPTDHSGFDAMEESVVRSALEDLRDSWERRVRIHPGGLSEEAFARSLEVYVPDSANDAARHAFQEFVNERIARARAVVEQYTSASPRWVLLTLPRHWRHPTGWWTGTIATYSKASDWGRRAALLLAPELVVRRLAEEAQEHGITYEELDQDPASDATDLLSALLSCAPPEPVHFLAPGVLDDVPVHERRSLTAEDAALLRTTEALPEQVYVVLSATHGVEILLPTVIEERCRNGWSGVLLAGASDLPEALAAPVVERALTARADREAWSRDHTDEALGRQDGEAWFNRFGADSRQELRFRNRLLILARTVPDLRDLGTMADTFHESRLGHGLLSGRRLDLDPFHPLGRPLFERGGPLVRNPGLGLPLAHLAGVQIYSTDMRQDLERMGHAPGCQHAPSRFGHEFSLMSAEEFMGIFSRRWCSVCGGYAVRYLDDGQLTYYRLAHGLHRLWMEVNGWADRLDRLPEEEVRNTLTELTGFETAPLDPRMDLADRLRWKGAVRHVRVQADRVLRHLRRPNRSTRARLTRDLRQLPETPQELASVDVRTDPLLKRHLKAVLSRAVDPGLQARVSTVLDHLGSGSPPEGFPALTLLRQARAHAAEADEWEIVPLLQNCLDFAENRLPAPDLQERHRLLKEGRRDAGLLEMLVPQLKNDLRWDIRYLERFLEQNPGAEAHRVVEQLTSLYNDVGHLEAPLNRPGRYVISRGRSELESWLRHAARNRVDVEDIEETARRISLSPEALSLVAADKEGELLLRAAELRRRKTRLEALRTLAEDPSVRESQLQKALMNQPWIFGGQYVGQATHRRLCPGDEVDLPLIRGDGSLHVVEIKRAARLGASLVKPLRGEYVTTSQVNDAVGQAANYLVNLDEQRDRIMAEFGIETRRAGATVLIGHPHAQPDVPEAKINETLRKMNTMVSRVEVLTYKELIDNAQRALGEPFADGPTLS